MDLQNLELKDIRYRSLQLRMTSDSVHHCRVGAPPWQIISGVSTPSTPVKDGATTPQDDVVKMKEQRRWQPWCLLSQCLYASEAWSEEQETETRDNKYEQRSIRTQIGYKNSKYPNWYQDDDDVWSKNTPNMNSLHLGHVTFVRMFDVSCCRRPTPSTCIISLQLKLRQLEVKEQPTGSLQLQVSLHQSAWKAGLHPLQLQSRSWTRRQISVVNSEHLEFPPRSFVSTWDTTTTVHGYIPQVVADWGCVYF